MTIAAFADPDLRPPPPRLAAAAAADEPLRCWFCDKPESEAEYMIEHRRVAICRGCIAVCAAMATDAGFPIAVKTA